MLPPCCKSSSPAASGSALKSRCCCSCCYYCLYVCLSVFLPECIGVDCPCSHTHTERNPQTASFLIPRRFLFVALPCECTSSVSGAHYEDDVAIVGKHTHTHKDAHSHSFSLHLSLSISVFFSFLPESTFCFAVTAKKLSI